MKNFFLIFLTSIFSAFIAVVAYRAIDEPQKVVIKETIPTKFVNQESVKVWNNSSSNITSDKIVGEPINFVFAADAATPAVVNIKATLQSDYFWKGGSYAASSGSGVIISSDGLIITNKHVIEDGDKIDVTLNDKRELQAEIIGIDPSTDLALIKIHAKDLPTLSFGNSDNVKVGEWVMAVGNPFNLESTVTAGIVSAKGRNIDILEDQYSIESFIQTDAAVNPGNSGGALVNTRGQLIGINTAIITRSGRYEGYSFAVPSNLAKKVIGDLKEYGEVQRAILGVSIEPVNDKRAKDLDLPNVEGVYIGRITPNGGADEAGLERADVIININGVMVRSVPELQEIVGRYRPGNVVSVQYYRDGNLRETEVTLKNKNNTLALSASSRDNMLLGLGFELRNLYPSESQRLRVEGVKVTSIIRDSRIERTKMDPDYIITKINDVRVTSVEEVIKEIKKADTRVMLEGFYETFPGEYYYTFAK